MSKAVYGWQQPANGVPDTYNLYVGPASGAEVLLVNVPGTQTTYTQLGTSPGSYYALVKAVYGGVESGASNEASAVITTPPISIPTLTATPALPGNVPSIILAGF